MNKFWHYTRLLRPLQWYKNFVIIAVGIFSFQIFISTVYFFLILGFICACGVSSSNYILNDIKDIELDKLHLKKKKRPIASEQVSKRNALLIVLILLPISLIFSFYISFWFFICMITFFLLSQAYTFFLKRFIFIDVITVSTLFIIRGIAGFSILTTFTSISYPTPLWGIWALFMLSLFLALTKRKLDQYLLEFNNTTLLKYPPPYPKKFLDYLLLIVAGIFLMGYYLYVIITDTTGGYLFLTIPPATYLLFRFLYLLFADTKPLLLKKPLLKDPGIVGGGIIVFILFLLVKYLESYNFL
ncbi:MAG: UbiA family prenyltransferase [Candidatus Helarchaeota archaeon]